VFRVCLECPGSFRFGKNKFLHTATTGFFKKKLFPAASAAAQRSPSKCFVFKKSPTKGLIRRRRSATRRQGNGAEKPRTGDDSRHHTRHGKPPNEHGYALRGIFPQVPLDGHGKEEREGKSGDVRPRRSIERIHARILQSRKRDCKNQKHGEGGEKTPPSLCGGGREAKILSFHSAAKMIIIFAFRRRKEETGVLMLLKIDFTESSNKATSSIITRHRLNSPAWHTSIITRHRLNSPAWHTSIIT